MEIRLNESNLKDAADWLALQDPVLARVLKQYGYPPLWARTPGFATLIHILLEQQVSLASAAAAFQRLQAHMEEITPANFLSINDQDLLKIGFSRQKRDYARGIALAIQNADFELENLHLLPEPALRAYMKKLKGVGDWTVDVYALMCLLQPDVLPKGDIALYESFRVLYALDNRPNHDFFVENTRPWQPWRSVGARMLWHFYLCERNRITHWPH